jgi:hypothetical protein
VVGRGRGPFSWARAPAPAGPPAIRAPRPSPQGPNPGARTSAALRPSSLTETQQYSTPLGSASTSTASGEAPFFLQKPSSAWGRAAQLFARGSVGCNGRSRALAKRRRLPAQLLPRCKRCAFRRPITLHLSPQPRPAAPLARTRGHAAAPWSACRPRQTRPWPAAHARGSPAPPGAPQGPGPPPTAAAACRARRRARATAAASAAARGRAP